MSKCPECGGTGYEAYFDEEGNQITEEEYNALPKGKRDREICSCCNGEGEIEDDSENYWEDDYDD